MKLLINTSSNYKGGGVQVAKSFIEECKKFKAYEYYIILSEGLAKEIHPSLFPNNFQFFKAPFRPATRFLSFQSHNYFLKEIESKFRPDVVFTTSGPSYWRPIAPHVMGYNLPNYIYPESPYFDEISYKKKMYWKGMKLLAKYLFKRDADYYLVQTDDVNQRLKKFLNEERVFTVSNTINSHYLSIKAVKKKLLKKGLNEFRLLTLSAWYPHKNLNIIPKVITELEKRDFNFVKFITTLPEKDYRKLDVSKNIFNVGIVKIEEGASLYRECDGLFLPTLLECFSASYAEAMVMEKPILTSDMGFAHTVCKDAALYFDPMDVEDIADKIILLYTSKNLQHELIQKGLKRLSVFGIGEDRAKCILEICKNLIDEQ